MIIVYSDIMMSLIISFCNETMIILHILDVLNLRSNNYVIVILERSNDFRDNYVNFVGNLDGVI